MKSTKIFLGLAFLLLLLSFTSSDPTEERIKIRISTNFGEMVVELFNETPLHRDNFVDLVENGFYDSLQFHRVIEKFMIQGGDPTSKNADSTANLGDGGPGYTLPAEIVDTIFHRRGALAAAREGDQINPHRRSSGSQFYIVQGQVINARQIADVNRKRVMMYGNQAFQKYLNDSANVDFKAEFEQAQRKRDKEKIKQLMAEHQPELTKITDQFKLTKRQEKIYSSVGGAPHLDGGYTVFGQLVSGFEVLDSIAAVPTDKKDRPLEPVIMEMEVISSID